MLTALAILSALPIWFFSALFLYGFLSDHIGVGDKTARVVACGATGNILAWMASGR